MRVDFRDLTLKDIALDEKGSIISGPFGSDISSKFFEETGIPVIRGNNLSIGERKFIDEGFVFVSEEKAEELNAYAIENDLVFTAAGTIGQVGLIQANQKYNRYVISNKQLRVRLDKSKVNPLYAYYWFSSPWMVKDIINKNTGSTVPLINLGIIKSLKIKIPKERGTQDAIANILNDLDSTIALNNRINTELEATAKLIYDYWFVQFDFPISKEQAKAMGNPKLEGKPYKASGGKMVWSEELKREVPEGWEITSLGERINVQRGLSYASSDLDESGVPMINLNSFNLNGTYKPAGLKYFAGRYSEKSKAFAGDLLIAATDVTRNAEIIGKAILVPSYYRDDLVYSMDIAKIIPTKEMTTSYLMMLFNSSHYHNYIKWYASGTLVLHLNIDGVKRYKTEIPPSTILKKYHDLYTPVAERIHATQEQNKKLSELRDWLLPMLMNGQVKIKDVEEKLAMAAELEVAIV